MPYIENLGCDRFWGWCMNTVLPMVYLPGLTMQELVYSMCQKINEIVDDQNELKQAMQDFLDQFDTNLEDTLTVILNRMLSDGRLTAAIEAINKFRYTKVTPPTLGDETFTNFSGNNWVGNNTDGIVYNGDGGDVLTLNFTATVNLVYLISFETLRIDPEDAFTIRLAGSPEIVTYNGTNTFNFALLAGGNNYYITPTATFKGNGIRNVSIKPIIETAPRSFIIYDKDTRKELFFEQYDSTNYFNGGGGAFCINADGNRFSGYNAGKNVSTGYWNVGIGSYSMQSATVPTRNVALGYSTLSNTVGGDRNVAIGTFAGRSLTNPSSNVLIGSDAMYIGTTGDSNVAIGRSSMSTANGNENVCVGRGTGASLASDGNTCIGTYAGTSAKTNGNNTYIGRYAGRYNSGGNNIAIGESAVFPMQSGSNLISIGNFIQANQNTLFTQIGAADTYVRKAELYGNYNGVASVKLDGTASFECYGADNATIGAFTAIADNTKMSIISKKLPVGYATQMFNRNAETGNMDSPFWIVNGNCMFNLQSRPEHPQIGSIAFDGNILEIYTNSGWKTLTNT